LALYEIRYGALGDFSGAKEPFRDREGQRLARALGKLDDVLKADIPPKKYAAFVAACQRQTDNINPRRRRHRTILVEFKNTKDS